MASKIRNTTRELSEAPASFSGFCPIAPVPKGRPRFSSRTHTTYTPAQTEKYESAVRKWMMNEYGYARAPMDGVIRARYEFVLERPASVAKKKWFSNTKPDIDNFEKSFQDALDFKMKDKDGKALGVIANDSRVSAVSATKRYAVGDEQPGTWFSFELLDSVIVLVSEDASEDVLKLLDPTYRKIAFTELVSLKPDPNVLVVYAIFGGESREYEQQFVELVEKKFPSAEKLNIL